MNARVPIFETDGLLQDALAKAANPAPAKTERTAPAAAPASPPEELDLSRADLWEIERRAREMRAQAIADLFARLFRAIDSWLWRIQQRDVERYLSKATDHADLERRLRELERSSSTYLAG